MGEDKVFRGEIGVQYLVIAYYMAALTDCPSSGSGEVIQDRRIVYIKITYWVDLETAKQKQDDLKKCDNPPPNLYTDHPWFSKEDFGKLIEKAKKVN